MRKLSYTLILLLVVAYVWAQSPHGEGLNFDCAVCHTSESWLVNSNDIAFNHDSTNYELIGQHRLTECKNCHTSLKFREVKSDCIQCHTDMHDSEFGNDCARCHTPETWIVKNIIDIHQQSSFPLLGAHRAVGCSECHSEFSKLSFESKGNDCFDCHQNDFQSSTRPNHVSRSFSKNCIECHGANATSWNTEIVDHEFFPLTNAHDVECLQCHTSGQFENIAATCISCHTPNYNSAQEPNHVNAGIPVECENCHTTLEWKPSDFNHSSTGFELSGSHSGIAQCSECHLGNITSASSECISCHQTQFNNAPDHVSQGFPNECTMCHNTNNWLEADFNHSNTNFPLTGLHTSVDCAGCHTNGFAGTQTNCSACHTKDFETAQNPNHINAGIPNECETCHTTNGWTPSAFNHTSTGFELTGSHSSIAQCSECHLGNVTSASSECISCHQTQFNSAPDHVSQGFPNECTMCHNTNNWLEVDFNHSNTNFPLTGLHTSVDCAGCHTNGFAGTQTNCSACHSNDFETAQEPGHVEAGIPNGCENCHTTVGWKPSTFDHLSTGFELSGSHSGIAQCSECHLGNVTSANSECISCHQTQYNNAPDHVSQSFPNECIMCHNTNNWLETDFNHSNTNFPLTGMHTSLDCASCHTDGFAGTPMLCSSCHSVDYNSAQEPNHINAGISNECETCHTTNGWQPSVFKHNTTGFLLTGGHRNVIQCSACHERSLTNASPECISCHQVQYNGAPDHVSKGYPNECTMCHNTNNWLESTFNHSNTGFPLTGLHTLVDCSSCHTTGFSGTPTNCSTCHNSDYNSAQDPNHVNAGLSNDCESCHTTNGWAPSSFNHSTTGFTLSGGHLSVGQCSECHQGNVSSASSECISCHQVQYNGAPDHLSQRYPNDCAMCHSTNNWLDANFNHSNTSFPLTGLHTSVDCSSCHTTGFSGTPTNCSACHNSDYNSAQDPNHVNAGLPSECENCHTTNGWTPSGFNHSATGFELTGSHRDVSQCSECHLGNVISASQECISCHQVQYNGAPNHVSQGYPNDCAMCHSTNNWLDANFNHSNTSFPLTGLHTNVDCASCHTSGFSGTPNSCSACHNSDYSTAQEPNHVNAGLPNECETCHTTNGWTPSGFNHSATGFELMGSHRDVSQCSECHLGNVTSASQECISCHQVQYNGAPNHISQGYPNDCVMCHNTSNWLESTFNHSNTGFPLTGLHASVDCSSCHTNGFAGTPDNCVACHNSDYNSAQDPNHTNAGLPSNCESCHSTSGWTPSSFNHSITGFTLTGSHLSIGQCSECHQGNVTSASTECISCHQVQYNGAPDHVSQGFPTSCTMCHTTNNWLETNFNHSNTGFPLTGAHTSVDCSNCHTGGFSGTSTDCYSCHSSDYNGTSSPNHSSANFSTNCLICHSTSRWTPATFDHDSQYFPIYSGKHRDEWNSCTDCHTNSNNYAVFSCLNCHEHNKSEMDKEHRGERGYAYVSSACLSCHPDGRD